MKISNMNMDWGTAVPVAVSFFARPEIFALSFAEIKKAKPRQLFLIADGPRPGRKDDEENCRKCREIADTVDWNCEVYHIYNDTNKGISRTYFDSMTEVFRTVDRCIYLEEDIIVSQSFFEYCRVLLDRYENDLRVSYITGMNVLGTYDTPDGDYFFSGEGSIWGYALWKRTFDSMNLAFRDNPYAVRMTKKVAEQIKPGYGKYIDRCVRDPEWMGHAPYAEFYKSILRFSQNQIHIVPTKNLISNIGVSSNAAHSADNIHKLPKVTQRLFCSKTYELTFPLKEPEFVIRDLDYEKRVNYMLAWNHPVLKKLRRMEALIRHLRYGDVSRVAEKMKLFLSGGLIE